MGHVQSTFSQELFKVFRREGRHHRYYNSPCSDWHECRHIPDAYQVGHPLSFTSIIAAVQVQECGGPVENCVKASIAAQQGNAGSQPNSAAHARKARRKQRVKGIVRVAGRVLGDWLAIDDDA